MKRGVLPGKPREQPLGGRGTPGGARHAGSGNPGERAWSGQNHGVQVRAQGCSDLPGPRGPTWLPRRVQVPRAGSNSTLTSVNNVLWAWNHTCRKASGLPKGVRPLRALPRADHPEQPQTGRLGTSDQGPPPCAVQADPEQGTALRGRHSSRDQNKRAVASVALQGLCWGSPAPSAGLLTSLGLPPGTGQGETAARLPPARWRPRVEAAGSTMQGGASWVERKPGLPGGASRSVHDPSRWLRATNSRPGGPIPCDGDQGRVPGFWAPVLRARLPGVSLPQRTEPEERGECGPRPAPTSLVERLTGGVEVGVSLKDSGEDEVGDSPRDACPAP